jgi:hypothetical protein
MMFASFLCSLRRYLSLIGQLLLSTMTGRRHPVAGLLMLLAFPLFLAWQLLHWLGFLLDEILFPGYRDLPVSRPIFIVGPPRSGTTHLHQVLSLDEQYTTFSTWECLFGLSISTRKLLLGLAAADRAVGRPFARLSGWLGGLLFAGMDDVHPLSLTAPEEDFLALMPLPACFLLAVPFPDAEWLWRTARCDEELAQGERDSLMQFYKACIKKHLYTHGKNKIFLSKNASFSGSTETLLQVFPDAAILICTRDPLSTVPSQLSSVAPARLLSGYADPDTEFRNRMIDLLQHYYLHLADTLERHPDRCVLLHNHALRNTLTSTVCDALTSVGRHPSPSFIERLEAESAKSREFVSQHRYTLQEFGLDVDLITSRFAPVYRRYDFAPPAQQGAS